MGKVAATVKKNFLLNLNKKVVRLSDLKIANEEAKKYKEELKSFQDSMINDGVDPLFQVYMNSMSFFSMCMYPLSEMPELKEFRKLSDKYSDLYMPSQPPMSPILDSYFGFWEAFDMRFGKDKETLGTVFLELAEVLKISEEELSTMKELASSRMGVYEVVDIKSNNYLLRELVSNKEYWCTCPSGYEGENGELWYTRILHSLDFLKDIHPNSTIGTTPYVMRRSTTKQHWLDFFERQKITSDNLDEFMKYGPETTYWNEYVFFAYSNFDDGVIFISGIPDKLSSLPCHREYSGDLSEVPSLNESNFEFIEDGHILDLPDSLNGKKVSRVFLDFAMPLINEFSDDLNSRKDLEHALKVPWTVWNMVEMGTLKELKKSTIKDKSFQTMINFFEKRKINDFSSYKYLLGDFQLVSTKDGFNLKMEARENSRR